jgi:hypothetical protein
MGTGEARKRLWMSISKLMEFMFFSTRSMSLDASLLSHEVLTTDAVTKTFVLLCDSGLSNDASDCKR